MKFIWLTDEYSKEWDNIVKISNDAWLFHFYDWLQSTENVWNLKSISFLVENNGEIVGIFPLQIHKTNRLIKSIFMGSAGAAIKNGINPSFRIKLLNEMYKHAEAIGKKYGSPFIEVYIPPLSNSSLNNQRGINPLINFSYMDISTQTWIVDLYQTEEILFQNLSHDARINIRNAKNIGYKLQKIQSINEIDKYYQIHQETYHRTGAIPHPKEYFLSIYKNICEKGYGTIWEALDHENIPIAFMIVGLFKKRANYIAGCCKTENLNSGVNYLLQYNSMLWAKSQGAKWFENGEAFPNIRSGKLRGLSIFKEKFGGELYRFYKGRLDLTEKSNRNGIFELTKNYFRDLLHSIKSYFKTKKILSI